MRQDSIETDEVGIDWNSDPSGSQWDDPRFHAVYVAGKGPFRDAVLDSSGVVRGLFRGRHPAEHAARMLALGGGYDPHAVLGTRFLPLSAPPRGECGSRSSSASRVFAGEA